MSHTDSTTAMAPLVYLSRPAEAGTVQPWLLVLMHGVGSNERDLIGLASSVPPQFHVVSLRAPNPVGPDAWAWFQFTVAPDGGRAINAAQEAASRDALERTVLALGAEHGVPAERIVLGGFSQGGIMALSMLLTRPGLLRAAMVLHSRLLPEVLPLLAPEQAFEGKAMWVSAGSRDAVLPLAQSHTIRAQVQRLPLTLTYAEFPNAHEITADELTQAMAWLGQLSKT